jgi:hypothetical protein
VNPAHLFEGTNDLNVADRDAKGRLNAPRGDRHGSRLHPERVPRGERHGMVKLTDQNVREIRAAYAAGGETLVSLGARFGVHFSQISNIVRGKQRKTLALTVTP